VWTVGTVLIQLKKWEFDHILEKGIESEDLNCIQKLRAVFAPHSKNHGCCTCSRSADLISYHSVVCVYSVLET
jgi:hypothetical protein